MKPLPTSRRHRERRDHRAAKGYTSSRARSCSTRPPALAKTSSCRPAATRRSGRGPLDRRRAAADAALRREARPVRPHQRRHGLHRQRPRLVHGRDGQELEPGWKTYVGFATSARVIHDPLIRSPFLRVLLWTFVFAPSPASRLVLPRPLPRDHARQEDALPAALPVGADHPLRDPRRSCRCSSGRASSTTTSGSSTRLPH